MENIIYFIGTEHIIYVDELLGILKDNGLPISNNKLILDDADCKLLKGAIKLAKKQNINLIITQCAKPKANIPRLPIDKETLSQLYSENSARDIAHQCGLSEITIRRAIKYYKLNKEELRINGIKRRAFQAIPG